MKRRILATTLVSAAAVVGLAMPASAATTVETRVNDCISTNVSNNEGHGWAQACDGYNVNGWITDDKADGRCPYVIFYTTAGSENGPRVGPKGTTRSFSFRTANWVTGIGIGWAGC
ncbi:hypothetical protein ACWDRR_23600 [Kitasatospora sp. NPDC003701]